MRAFNTTLLIGFAIAGLSAMLWYFAPTREVSLGTQIYEVDAGMPQGLSAEAWLLFDVETGEELAGKDALAVVPIASVTKLMTAEVAFSQMDLATTTMISFEAYATEGRAGRLSAGEWIAVRELIFPLLLESSNDAASALAEAYGPPGTFIEGMEKRADELGMTATTFRDPSGLSPDNRSTAKDLKSLLMHFFHERRHVLDITMLTHYVGKDHDWMNNDPVVGVEGYRGGKHGFTDEAGRTFAGVFEVRLSSGQVRPIGIILLKSNGILEDVELLRTFTEERVRYRSAF